MNKMNKMNKNLLIIVLIYLTLSLSGHAQDKQKDSALIEWKRLKKITWNNFSKKRNTTSVFKAECTTFFVITFHLKQDSVLCNVRTFFDSNKSWRLIGYNLNDIYDLNHEQIHFDITEIFAREIRKRILSKNLNEKEIEIVFNENVRACNVFQNEYDNETNHSINKIKQAVWDKRIKDLLLSLDMFKEQAIYIKQPICKICWAE